MKIEIVLQLHANPVILELIRGGGVDVRPPSVPYIHIVQQNTANNSDFSWCRNVTHDGR
jgi:hypothetical protein